MTCKTVGAGRHPETADSVFRLHTLSTTAWTYKEPDVSCVDRGSFIGLSDATHCGSYFRQVEIEMG